MASRVSSAGMLLWILLIILWLPTITRTTSAEQHHIPDAVKASIMEKLVSYDVSGGSIDTSAIYAIDGYWHLQDLNPSDYGLNPDENNIFMLILDIHAGALPGHGGPYPQWEKMSYLLVNSNTGTSEFSPSLAKLIVDSVHHQVIALEFPKQQRGGATTIPSDSLGIEIVIRGLEGPNVDKQMKWSLPLSFSQEANSALGIQGLRDPAGLEYLATPASLIAIFPLVAGLLVYFSPCFMEMTAVYLALISGIKVSELSEHKDSKGFRMRLLASALLFVGGFAFIYTAAGVVAGYSGQIMQGSIFDTLSLPFRIVGGSLLVYLGVQSTGAVPRIFGLRSSPLFPRVNASCRTGGSFVVGLTFGCLQCFRGSLVVAMLFYAWTLGSAGMGGTIMLMLALTFGIPFILIALVAGRTSFLERLAPRIARIAGFATSTFLVALGVLTIFSAQHPLIDPIYTAWKALVKV